VREQADQAQRNGQWHKLSHPLLYVGYVLPVNRVIKQWHKLSYPLHNLGYLPATEK
jgi:hypothetical protein